MRGIKNGLLAIGRLIRCGCNYFLLIGWIVINTILSTWLYLLIFFMTVYVWPADQLETAPAVRTPGSEQYMQLSDPNPTDGPKWCATQNGTAVMNPRDTDRYSGRCYVYGPPAKWACPSGYYWSPQVPIEWDLVTATQQPATCVKGQQTACGVGEVRNPATGLCEPEAQCKVKAGSAVGTGRFDYGTNAASAPATACMNSCLAVFDGSAPTHRYLKNGVYRYIMSGTWTSLGDSCTDGTGDPTSTGGSVPKDTCGDNQDMASMNGVTKCFDRATKKPIDPTTGQTTDKPSTDSTGNTSSETKPDGTKVETTVNCTGTKCTTTTTTTRPDGTSTTVTTGGGSGTGTGGGTGTGDDNQNQPGFCEENPQSPICQESSFSGSCDTSFSCDGDAASCATAKAANELKCAIKGEPNSTSRLGDSMMAGTDSFSDMSGITSNVNAGSIDKSAWLPSACIQDRTIEVMGNQITLPFSEVCSWLQILGVVLQVLSSIVAIRIVLGGIQ